MFTHPLLLAQDSSDGSPAERVDSAVNDVTSWWNNPSTRDLFVARPLKILLIIVVAMLLNWLANRIINRATQRGITNAAALLNREANDTPQARSKENRRQQRMRTLANVGRSIAAIIIWTWAVLAVLDQLDVNVAPLIASAGIVGVAIGFGAQSLVKDFFSGMFILLENQYGVGDTIEVGSITGEVEEMTLRITTIRDMDGTLWYVRNGDIDQVGNHSDRFSIARLQIPVSIMANPDQASRVIEDAAVAAASEPAMRGKVIETPAMLGPSDFTPTYVSFRLAVKTMPGEQWAVARHLQHRILAALHEAGVVLTPMDSVLVDYVDHNGQRTNPHDKEHDKEIADGHHPDNTAR